MTKKQPQKIPYFASMNPTIRKALPWFICILAALFYCYEFILRITPSVMVTQLMHAYGINAATLGLLSSVYYYAYTPMQLPVGMLMDRYSPRRMLSMAILFCTIGSLLIASIIHLSVAEVARLMMGFGSSFAFVGVLKLAANWLPSRYFALISGLTTTLGMLGAVFGDVTLTKVVDAVGWQHAWLLIGAGGVVLSLLMWLVIRDRPYRVVADKDIGEKHWEKAFSWFKTIVKNPQFYLCGLIGGMIWLPIAVFGALWGLSFLEYGLHFNAEIAARATSMLFVGMAIGGPLNGWLSDYFGRRRIFLQIGSLGAAILFVILIHTPNLHPLGADIIVFFVGLFIGCQPLCFAINREISPHRAAGTAVAGTNFLVSLGPILFQPLIGKLLDITEEGSSAATAKMEIFTYQDYSLALSIVPTILFISFILTFLVKETYCKPIKE